MRRPWNSSSSIGPRKRRRPDPNIDREIGQSSGGAAKAAPTAARGIHLTASRPSTPRAEIERGVDNADRLPPPGARGYRAATTAPSPFPDGILAQKRNGAPAKRHRARIHTARSLFFQLLVLANLTARPFHERFGRRLRMSLSEWRVLLVVADHPAITAQDLADYIGLDKMSISRAVRGLAARGRLAREASARD